MTRRLLYQLALIALIAGGAWWLGATAQANLARLGVDAGIDFLWQRAGFEIGQTLIPFDADSSFARAFVVALLNTLVLAATGVVCATTVGGAIGLCRLSGNWLVSRLAAIYVELLRNVPAWPCPGTCSSTTAVCSCRRPAWTAAAPGSPARWRSR